ncbi:MAG: HD domain-containing protein [Thermoanaerobaculia bacterium]|nr:HD domain-containing protein [Thermoanaerobaculia bacterium]
MKLRHQLFLLLVVSGMVPLAISSYLLVRQNRGLLETEEKSYLTRSASFLSIQLDDYLGAARAQLRQLGEGLLAPPGPSGVEDRFRQRWVDGYLRGFLESQPDVVTLRLLSQRGVGPQFSSVELAPEAREALAEAFETGLESGQPVYRMVVLPGSDRPLAVIAVPVAPAGSEILVVEGVLAMRPIEPLFRQEAQGETSVFLVDRDGAILWSQGATAEVERAVAASDLLRDFARFPLNLTAELELEVEGRSRRLLTRISPVAAPGWGVVVNRPLAGAFASARRMAFNTVVSTALLLLVALAVAAVVARRVSRPIQSLAEGTHEIAEGNFGKRVDPAGLGPEIGALAADFNRMGEHVERQIRELRQAAQENREIFIGSMRAFVAAIDAKDPYTRGHSERVATYARTITRALGLDEEAQQQVWIGALLHDVGKLGIDDAILKKGGVLTSDEYEEMKRHPAIGAEIMSRIDQLRDVLPIIRSHHEAWNGRGYPDGLRGEETPLIARIVCVADTFDAITTNRPYQRAYEARFAVETIRRLTGARFDAKVVTAFLRAFEAGQIRLRPTVSTPPTAVSA